MELYDSILSSENIFDSPYWLAQKILRDMEYKKTSELSDMVGLSMSVFAEASGYYILPAPKWKTESTGYTLKEIRNYILLFSGLVELDISQFEHYKDGADLWLKSIQKEYIAENAKNAMLDSFDCAYKDFEKRRCMTKGQVTDSKKNCIEKYNKTFRECPEMKHGGLFFAEDLESVHTA